jgi:hypothetical protein
MYRTLPFTLCLFLAIAAVHAEESTEAESRDEPAAQSEASATEEGAEDAAEPAPPRVDPAKVQALIDRLAATDYQTREQATDALKRIGRPAKAALQAVIDDEQADAETKLRAETVLKVIRVRELRRGIREADRELHIIGCYEGAYPPGVGHGGGQHPEGAATVRVDRPGKAVTLVLTAYEPVRWTIQPSDATFIERIILAGYHGQTLAKKPAGAAVESRSAKAGDQTYFFAYKQDGRYQRMVNALEDMTDLPVTSFQGRYKLERPAVIADP